MRSKVVTFYSYKGGVGRSFALANVATILAQWGARVLVVDWDIEAPGLDHYFASYRGLARAGVLDFLEDCTSGTVGPWSKYCQRIDAPGLRGEMRLMPACGDQDAAGKDYMALVQSLNWDSLYEDFDLGGHLERMRAAWLENFDFVLLDSRTGLTDFSGVTTAQLPDILLFMFTANQQSLSGCAGIARRALEARRAMPLDRPAILPLPIPARIEQRDEYDQAQRWRVKFENELSEFLDTWVPKDIDRLKLLDQITIPYVPRWTFGEEIAALAESGGKSGIRSPSEAASYACETIAAVLALGLEKTDLLTSSRDEYVHSARSSFRSDEQQDKPIRLFISSQRGPSTKLIVFELVQQLMEATRREVEVLDPSLVQEFEPTGGATQALVEKADVYAVMFDQADASVGGYQAAEVEWMIRQNLRDTRPRPLVPLVLPGGESEFYASRLADYQATFIEPDEHLGQSLTTVVRRLTKQLARENTSPATRGEDFLDRTSPEQPMTLGAWSRSSSGWSGSGPTKFLLSNREYSRSFRVSVQLQFEGGDAAIDAALIFGWSQPTPSQRTYWAVHILSDKIVLEHHLPDQAENLVMSAQLDASLAKAFRVKKPHRLILHVDQAEVVLMLEGNELLRTAAPDSISGRVGLRARNTTTICTAFEVEVVQ